MDQRGWIAGDPGGWVEKIEKARRARSNTVIIMTGNSGRCIAWRLESTRWSHSYWAGRCIGNIWHVSFTSITMDMGIEV